MSTTFPVKKAVKQISNFRNDFKYSTDVILNIPEKIKKLKPHLEKLEISAPRIEEEHNLYQLVNLKFLTLSLSNLTTVSSQIVLLTNLQKLDLSHNRICNVPKTIFNISKLTYLNLNGNQIDCINYDIKKLVNLNILLLNSNDIKHITIALLQLPNLTTLDLSHNQINGDILYTFHNDKIINNQLRCLYLQMNQLKKVPEILLKTKRLRELKLDHNAITSFSQSVVGYLDDLEVLTLSYNKIDSSFVQTISNLTNLRFLNLSNNSLHTIHQDIKKLTNLKILNLTRTDIEELPFNMKFDKLEYLYLASNRLTKLPSTLSNCPNLISLVASSNRLSSIQDIPSLNRLTIPNNLFNSVPKLSNVTYIDVSFNNITSIRSVSHKLKKLKLQGNKIYYMCADVINLAEVTITESDILPYNEHIMSEQQVKQCDWLREYYSIQIKGMIYY